MQVATLKHEEERFYNQSLRETVKCLKIISSVPPKTYGEMLLSRRKGRKNNGKRQRNTM